MKGRQINFFAMPDEWGALEKYLEENNMISIATRMEKNEIIPEKISEKGIFKYLVQKKHLNKLKIYYLKETNKYYIDEVNSPVIQFHRSFLDTDKNKLKRSRIYFAKGFWNDNNEWIDKPTLFIKKADELLKWFKKEYKPEKLSEYKGIFITPSVKKKLQANALNLKMY